MRYPPTKPCLAKRALKEKREKEGYPSIAYKLADELGSGIDADIRVTVPGHYQRGGPPVPYDRVFATRLGAFAADLIINKQFGFMVGSRNNKIIKVPLKKVAGKLKKVDPESEIIMSTKALGITFGD